MEETEVGTIVAVNLTFSLSELLANSLESLNELVDDRLGFVLEEISYKIVGHQTIDDQEGSVILQVSGTIADC